MSDKVTELGKHSGSSVHTSPEQALKDALAEIGKNGAFKDGKKLLVLALDDTDGCYSVSFVNAGMKASECVALCEIAKSIFKEDMGY